ncbi:MAG: gamma-butyrobetaine hydroxylase-like domain-containing protein [bacterium]
MTPADSRSTTPAAIANQPDGSGLRIVWRDAHESIIPLLDLRRACPCATCGHEKQGSAASSTANATADDRATTALPKPSALRMVSGPAISDLALSRIAGVGRYAVQCFWADGHDTGIYSFELLRSLCPCDSCRPEKNKNPEE